MEFVIVVYRSRNMSMRVYNFLASQGVTCALISTPRNANVGCGLSVKLSKSDWANFREALASAETFVGFFLMKNTFSGSTLVRL